MTKKFYTFCERVGNKIYVRGIKDEKRFIAKLDYSPSLFVKSHNQSNFKTLEGDNLSQVTFESIKKYDDYKKKFSDVSNMELYGVIQPHYQYLHENYPPVVEYDFESIRIAVIDIETTVNHGFPDWNNPIEEIMLITVTDLNTKETWTFGRKPISRVIDGVNYNSHESEEEMLQRFISHWSHNYPDVITGWNIEDFDVPYLYRRIMRVCGETWANKLSPFNQVEEVEREFNGQQKLMVEFVGIATLDYLALYKKFAMTPQENYKLDTVCHVELNENKLDFDSIQGTFRLLYGSKDVVVNPKTPVEELAPFERWCRMKDKINEEINRRNNA